MRGAVLVPVAGAGHEGAAQDIRATWRLRLLLPGCTSLQASAAQRTPVRHTMHVAAAGPRTVAPLQFDALFVPLLACALAVPSLAVYRVAALVVEAPPASPLDAAARGTGGESAASWSSSRR